MKPQVVLFGSNGHQIDETMIVKAGGVLRGVCNVKNASDGVKVYASAEEIAQDKEVSLVSVCAPLRSQQHEAIRIFLSNGKHVYAEKPCVMEEEHLDELLALSHKNHVFFCEMAGSLLESPYFEASQLISQGEIGEVIQVLVQKSYPYGEWRPQNEEIDGGLVLQNAIYGVRFTEHIAHQMVKDVWAMETGEGNPGSGELKMACSLQMSLENGGISSVIANYLNQPSTGVWGNEELRVFGTKGYLRCGSMLNCVEIFHEKEKVQVPLRSEAQRKTLLEILLHCIAEEKPLPFSCEYLSHPTRVAIIAKKKLKNNKNI